MKKTMFMILTLTHLIGGTYVSSAEYNTINKAIYEDQSLQTITSVIKQNPNVVNAIDIIDNTRTFPLQMAVDFIRPDVARELLQNGAVMNIVNDFGGTPLTRALTWLYHPNKSHTSEEKEGLENIIDTLVDGGASLYLGLLGNEKGLERLRALREDYKDVQRFRAHLPDEKDKKLNVQYKGYTPKEKISLTLASSILQGNYAKLSQDRYELSLHDVLSALAYKLPEAFLGGLFTTTQFRTTAIAQPILYYLEAAQKNEFTLSDNAKRTLRLIAALVAVRTAHKKELFERAKEIFLKHGHTLTKEERLRLRCYYPIDKLNRYRDDVKEMERLLKKK